jgi:hypothetical protein
MNVSAFDSLAPYPEDATGYHLVCSQQTIACNAQGIPKDTSFTLTVYRKKGENSLEIATGVYITIRVTFPGVTRTHTSRTGAITVPLVDNAFAVPQYAQSVTAQVGESSYDIHDIADFPVGFTLDGEKGNNGRLPIPYGEYNSEATYVATDLIAPYVLCAGQYYVMNKTTGVKGLNPQSDYAANGTNAIWVLLENYKAIFVELLMANLGLIGKAVFYNEYMYSQYGKDGNTSVTEEGRYSTPKDAGGSFDPNFLINFLTGYFRCTNADITGVINAVSGVFRNITSPNGNFGINEAGDFILKGNGQLGGFRLSGNGLSNSDEEGKFLNDAYVIFRNDIHKCFAGIGGNILPAASGARGVARFENHDESDWFGLGSNYALLLSAQGANDNVALALNGGYISCVAVKAKTVSATTTLGRDVVSVACINNSEITITLPTMQVYDDGHVIKIKNLNGSKVNIKPGYSYHKSWNSTAGVYDTLYKQSYIHADRGTQFTNSSPDDIESNGDAAEYIYHRDLNNGTQSGCWIQYKHPRDW